MEKEENKKGVLVKTYAEDMARVIEDDKEGLVKKIIHGEEIREMEKKNLSPDSEKNKVFVFIGFLLIFISLGSLAYILLTQKAEEVEVPISFTPLIFNDQTSYLEMGGLKKDEVERTLANRVKSINLLPETIEGIYLTENKQIIGLRKFLSFIESNLKLEESNALVSDNFLIGISNTNKKNDFFMLLKMRSMSDIFSSLKNWEKKMFIDLYPLFGFELSSENAYFLEKEFENTFIENKNARAIFDNNQNLILAYVFANDNSVIISNSKSTIHELVLRLASSKIEK